MQYFCQVSNTYYQFAIESTAIQSFAYESQPGGWEDALASCDVGRMLEALSILLEEQAVSRSGTYSFWL